ncbi:hypothetical protein GOQ09_21905 [Variovorax paradoxus]|uniref:DUF4124 domain-containing protein n=1 Tax=Variovorax paradoxus TaxID=34073 RepID=A0A6I6HQ81_VARPD|nr:hypothetical protein GOQ09_21905 [Variovorax paradoxus]
MVLIASSFVWLPAAAQGRSETYRCGNTYTDRPCEGGKPVKVDDLRTDADRRASEAATHKAEVRADQLERIRLSQEKEAYERDRRSAHEARQAAVAERKLASSEQLAQARARKLASEPHKSSTRFSGASAGKPASPPDGAGSTKKRKPSSGSDAG